MSIKGVITAGLNQEHGMLHVDAAQTDDPACAVLNGLGAFSRLRLVPNHACATSMMHRAYHLVRNGRAVALARRFGGW